MPPWRAPSQPKQGFRQGMNVLARHEGDTEVAEVHLWGRYRAGSNPSRDSSLTRAHRHAHGLPMSDCENEYEAQRAAIMLRNSTLLAPVLAASQALADASRTRGSAAAKRTPAAPYPPTRDLPPRAVRARTAPAVPHADTSGGDAGGPSAGAPAPADAAPADGSSRGSHASFMGMLGKLGKRRTQVPDASDSQDRFEPQPKRAENDFLRVSAWLNDHKDRLGLKPEDALQLAAFCDQHALGSSLGLVHQLSTSASTACTFLDAAGIKDKFAQQRIISVAKMCWEVDKELQVALHVPRAAAPAPGAPGGSQRGGGGKKATGTK